MQQVIFAVKPDNTPAIESFQPHNDSATKITSILTTLVERRIFSRQSTTTDEGLRLDALVEDLVICELKAVDTLNPVWKAQMLSHLKLTGKRL